MRSGREHWAWTVVVEIRQGTLWIAGRSWTRRTRRGRGEAGEAEGRRRGRTQATDIKSNNPHLAGGEQKTKKASKTPVLKRPAAALKRPAAAAVALQEPDPKRAAVLKIIPAELLERYAGGCSRCYNRKFCTVSCWARRGYKV